MFISAHFIRFIFSIAIMMLVMVLMGCRSYQGGYKKDSETPRMDTLAIIRKAKFHNAYWTEYWVSPTSITFDEKESTWTVHSVKTHHTNRGDCKHTNGCTVVKSVTLTIDDQNKKVISKTKEKIIFPNYE